MNTLCSVFSQILKFIPRSDFEGEVRKLNAQRHARGVSCWQQFVSMMFCQLGRAHSLREIEQGLKSCEGKLSHLGIEGLPRSSLSYANAHRPWQLYERTFHLLLRRFQAELAVGGGKRQKKFRFKNTLEAEALTTGVNVFGHNALPNGRKAARRIGLPGLSANQVLGRNLRRELLRALDNRV